MWRRTKGKGRTIMKKNKTIILRIDEEMYNEIIKVKRDDENLSETVRGLIEIGLPFAILENDVENR